MYQQFSDTQFKCKNKILTLQTKLTICREVMNSSNHWNCGVQCTAVQSLDCTGKDMLYTEYSSELQYTGQNSVL